MWDPYRASHREQPRLIYLGACLIVGIRLAREKQVNVRVIPIRDAIHESIEQAREVFREVWKDVPESKNEQEP